jgi:hypothetical protein
MLLKNRLTHQRANIRVQAKKELATAEILRAEVAKYGPGCAYLDIDEGVAVHSRLDNFPKQSAHRKAHEEFVQTGGI